MKKKILILGGSGLIGFGLLKGISSFSDYDVSSTLFNKVDKYSYIKKIKNINLYENINVLNLNKFINFLETLSVDIIINCIGVTKHVSDDPCTNIQINSYFPNFLSNHCYKKKIKLIHISTDCVFSGLTGSYIESDKPDATDIYGKSKSLGEVIYEKSLVIRTSTIGMEYKNKTNGLFNWFFNNKKKFCYGYENAYFYGLTTNELAKIISKNIIPQSNFKGLYNISGPRINKYDLLCLIKKKFNLPIVIKKNKNFKIDRSLKSIKFEKEFNYKKKEWSLMLDQLKEDYENQ